MALNSSLKQNQVDGKKPINTMTVKEFRKRGFLRELNRQFLHPLGLAISVHIDNHGGETFGLIWNYLEDPEGLLFNGLYTKEFEQQAKEIEKLKKQKAKMRKEKYGFVIQPYNEIGSSPRPLNNRKIFGNKNKVKKNNKNVLVKSLDILMGKK